mmetsp:Transcript_23907/g.73633  ORF Transcript_23907/g.73633 Transcript_23907/m.73633 type:complete len:346 (+) Transcript_23907:1087-2124(+)
MVPAAAGRGGCAAVDAAHADGEHVEEVQGPNVAPVSRARGVSEALREMCPTEREKESRRVPHGPGSAAAAALRLAGRRAHSAPRLPGAQEPPELLECVLAFGARRPSRRPLARLRGPPAEGGESRRPVRRVPARVAGIGAVAGVGGKARADGRSSRHPRRKARRRRDSERRRGDRGVDAADRRSEGPPRGSFRRVRAARRRDCGSDALYDGPGARRVGRRPRESAIIYEARRHAAPRRNARQVHGRRGVAGLAEARAVVAARQRARHRRSRGHVAAAEAREGSPPSARVPAVPRRRSSAGEPRARALGAARGREVARRAASGLCREPRPGPRRRRGAHGQARPRL